MENKKGRREKTAVKVLDMLRNEYPEAKTELSYKSPFQLLIATILSAQCTDQRVNIVTKELFKKYRTPKDLAGADPSELENEIRSTGFFRMKTKNIMACSRDLLERHGGEVPSTMEELVSLSGVGRKTANVVLSEAFGKNEGIVVDTHVQRVSRRLGWTEADNADRIEEDLMAAFGQKDWGDIGRILILHGRRVCAARKPKCGACAVAKLCPSAELP